MATIKTTVRVEIKAADGETTTFHRVVESHMQDNPIFWEDAVDNKIDDLKKSMVNLTRFQFGSKKEN